MSMPATTKPRGPEKPEVGGFQSENIPFHWLVLRVFWVAVELTLAGWLAWQAQPFFYQRF